MMGLTIQICTFFYIVCILCNECKSMFGHPLTEVFEHYCNLQPKNKEFLKKRSCHYLAILSCSFSDLQLLAFFYNTNSTTYETLFPEEQLPDSVLTASFLSIKCRTVGHCQLMCKEFPNLETFVSSKHDFTTFRSKHFRCLHTLKKLRLSRNCLNELSPDLFSGLDFLLYLYLHFSFITDCKTTISANLKCLRELDLTGCCSVRHPDAIVFANIKELLLAKNKLSETPNVFYRFFPNLGVLNVDHNLAILVFPQGFFRDVKKYNCLTSARMWRNIQHSTRINLKKSGLNCFQILVFSHNQLFKIPKGTFIPLASLKKIDLAHNPLHLISSLYTFGLFYSCGQFHSVFNEGKTHSKQPTQYFYQSQKQIQPSNIMLLGRLCLKKCLCEVKENKKIQLYCRGLHYTATPLVIPPGVDEVFLERNNIVSMFTTDPSWENVTHLYLTKNKLKSLHNWSIPPKLRQLELNENQLVDLPSSLIEKIDSTPDFQIYLAKNNFKCNCEYSKFIKWLKENQDKIKDFDVLTCSIKNPENSSIYQEVVSIVEIEELCLSSSSTDEQEGRPLAKSFANLPIPASLVLRLAFYYWLYNTIVI